jgi:hypothetical protein
MLPVLLMLMTLPSMGNCAGDELPTKYLQGVWEAYDYKADRFFSLNIPKSGKAATLVFLFGPPHQIRARTLSVGSVEVNNGAIRLEAADRYHKITVSGCVDAGEKWGIISRATLMLRGSHGEHPQEIFLEFVKGAYIERRAAFSEQASKERKAPAVPPSKSESKNLVKPSELPSDLQDVELPSDVLVNPKDLRSIRPH